MQDSEVVKILIAMLKKYPLSDEGRKAAIGLRNRTKLVEVYVENRKRARDRKLLDI
jgi:hypothetical protein